MEQSTQQGLTPTQPANLPTTLKPSLGTEIVKQKDHQHQIVTYLLSVWVKARIEILQMSSTLVPTESKEEFGLIQRMMRQYGTITPAEFAECIRLAAIDKQRDLAHGDTRFPTLYAADFEEQIQKMTLKKMKANENPLQLAANTGGNAFFGEPSEALNREWPKIVAQVEKMRKLEPFKYWRDRFWYGGSEDQKESAREMLRQMFHEMTALGFTTREKINDAALSIFKIDYWTAFPDWRQLADGLSCPMKADEIKHLRDRTLGKIGGRIGSGFDAPSIDNFPDPQDCTFCAIFDAYLEFSTKKHN